MPEGCGKSNSPSTHGFPTELRDRLAKAPIRFDFRLQLPDSGDKIDNPSIAWSGKNKTVDLGVIEITSVVPDSDTAQRNLLFLPGVLPVGIEPADPMIQFRDKAYPISYDRRHGAETENRHGRVNSQEKPAVRTRTAQKF
jgi:hypothetical protein